MYAVIKTGGKQYRVSPRDVVRVEKLEAEVGARVAFNDVLMIGGGETAAIGAPMLVGAVVEGEVLDQIRDDKVYAFKRRRRKHSSKSLKGHRQYLTVVRVTDIIGTDGARASDSVQGAAPVEPQKPANLLSDPEGAPENLSELSGVDMDAQMKLYDLGVFHFWQLNEMSAAELAWVGQEAGVTVDRAAWTPVIRKQSAGRKPALPGSKPANLLQVPKGDRDDLTKLTGVDDAAQELLYDLGAFHFWQIAAWNDDEAANAAARIASRGPKIDGGQWIEDAKSLANG